MSVLDLCLKTGSEVGKVHASSASRVSTRPCSPAPRLNSEDNSQPGSGWTTACSLALRSGTESQLCFLACVYLFIPGCFEEGKIILPVDAEAPSRKTFHLPLFDHYPGLGLLYYVWHFEAPFCFFSRPLLDLCLGEG